MKTYGSKELASWHEQEQDTPFVERAEIGGFAFNYYLADFEGAPCDNLVSVLVAEDPKEGIEPIIKVSLRIPEEFRGAFALHEYIEFHASQLDPTLPQSCWEIERFIIGQFTDPRQADEYAARRIDMFSFIENDLNALTYEMQDTKQYLLEYVRLSKEAKATRAISCDLHKRSQAVAGDALDIERQLRAGFELPLTAEQRSANVIAEFLRTRPDQTAQFYTGDVDAERMTDADRHDRMVAGLLYRQTLATDREERSLLSAEITTLTKGVGPTAEQERIALSMAHRHDDIDPDTKD